MTENTKRRVRIIGLVVCFLSLAVYSGIVIVEFWVSKYGEIVDAKVADVSEICRHKRKYVTLLVESDYERIKIYGPACGKDEFRLGSIIQVRRSKRLDFVVIPNNLGTVRLMMFPIFTGFVLWALFLVIRKVH